jgi:hypothetical protein
MQLGLLADRGPLAEGMRIYSWDWSGAARREAPVGPLPAGAHVLGSLDLGWLPDEAAHACSFRGADAGRCLAIDLRLWPRGPLAPEGGRRLTALRFSGVPAGTRSLLLRAVFDQGGRLYAGHGGAWSDVVVAPSDGQAYTQVRVPLAAADSAEARLAFTSGHGPDDQPHDWALYRVWFLDQP